MKKLRIFVAIFCAFTTPSYACSLIEGAFLQSNFEMIDASDAIVIGRAVRTTRGEFGNRVFFEVTATLKGDPGSTVVDQHGYFGDPTPSDPDDISAANPEAYMGPCVRGTYRRGDSYVLMLRKDEHDGFVVSGDAFSRMNEDDFGPDSLWRKAIETYLEIQKNPDRMAQLDAMRELAHHGMREDATPFEQKIGEDALRHLMTIHPDKPTQWLMNVYEDPDFAYRGFDDMIAGTEEEKVNALVSLVFDRSRETEDAKSVAARALAEGDHAQAEPLFREIINQEAPRPTELAAALAFFIKRGDHAPVKLAFAQHILWIEGITGPGAGPGFWSVINRTVGYGERRTVSAQFGDWWDRQRFASCILQSSPTNCSFYKLDVDELLANPIANEKLLLTSARNEAVQDWANSEIDRLKADGVSPRDRQWDLPVNLLLAAYSRDKPERVIDLACGSKEEREIVAINIGTIRTYQTENLLYEMMAIEQHEHVRGELFTSAVKFVADRDLFSRTRSVGRAYEYARANGPLPLRKHDDKHLPCH